MQVNDRNAPLASPGGRRRWIVVALLFAATAINYIDRQMIGVLKPTLTAEFGWSESDFANIVFWFQMAYAIGYLAFGKVVDVIGARLGYAVAIVIWTISHMALPPALPALRRRASGWALANRATSPPASAR